MKITITLEINGESIWRSYMVNDGDFSKYGEVIEDMADTLMTVQDPPLTDRELKNAMENQESDWLDLQTNHK